MSNLQITLSIVGVLLIIAIVGHGFWTMRRQNQHLHRQKREVSAKREQAKNKDTMFDDDGVGEVRVVKTAADTDKPIGPTATGNEAPESSADKPQTPPSTVAHRGDDIEQMSMNLDIDDDDAPLPSMRVKKDDADEISSAESDLSLEDEQINEDSTDETAAPTQSGSETIEQGSEPTASSTTGTSSQPPQEVISLFVKGSVQGAVLLQMMTELGCKFGEMGIFHRYEQTSGNGPLIFSVANMFNPGTFDLDNIENFETEGVALFMTLPLAYDGQQAFNMMLNAAKKLAMEIPQGQVLDGQRHVLSRQSIQKAHQQIREFEKLQANA